jgi:hypothetical protein
LSALETLAASMAKALKFDVGISLSTIVDIASVAKLLAVD